MENTELLHSVASVIVGLIVVGVVFSPIIVLTWPAIFGRRSKLESGDDSEPCRECGYDVRGELLICPECGSATRFAKTQKFVRLREEWPTESMAVRSPSTDELPVVVWTADNGELARLLGQHLQARGIRADVSSSKSTGIAAVQRTVTSYRITVWSEDEERARAIIAHLCPPAEAIESAS